MKKKILHFADDEKFIKYAYQEFTNDETMENVFYIFSSESALTHIDFPTQIVQDDFFHIKDNIALVQSFDAIIIHFLHERYYTLLKNTLFTKKIFWMGWGGDYYWLIDTSPNFNIYQPITRRYVGESQIEKHFNYAVKYIKRFTRRKKLKILNRLDYFCPVLEIDYEMIKKNNPTFAPTFIPWSYGNLEDNLIKGLENETVTGHNILIGNSATLTNNHLDIFDVMERLDLRSKHIILPLSYGDDKYRRMITAIANKKFAELTIMEDFVNYAEYQQILLNSGNVFMGHIRQQAMGNIATSLYLGAKVFFFCESVVYKHLINNGFMIFNFEDLQKDPQMLNSFLLPKYIERNRVLAIELWGKITASRKTKTLISQI